MESNRHGGPGKGYDPARMLDALALHTRASSDASLAKALKISKHLIGWIRQGRYPLSATLILQIHEATGLSIGEIRNLVGDRRRVMRISARRMLNPEIRNQLRSRRTRT